MIDLATCKLSKREFQTLRRRDKRTAAVHEAGHVAVAEVLGREVRCAWIWPNTSPAAGLLEKTWLGRAEISYVHIPSEPIICVAGIVAEQLASCDNSPAWGLLDVIEYEPGAISETDASGLPNNEKDRLDVIEKAITILAEYKQFHTALTARLLRDHVIYQSYIERMIKKFNVQWRFDLRYTAPKKRRKRQALQAK